MTESNPSPYQQAIYKFVREEHGSAVVEAAAGSGKTTTALGMLAELSRRARVVYLAFNSHTAREIGDRAPVPVDALTLHALGRRAVEAKFPGIELNNRKLPAVVDRVCRTASPLVRQEFARLVSLVKATWILPTDRAALLELLDRHAIELGDETERWLQQVPRVLELLLENRREIDYDDMIYYPLALDLPMPQYDFIGVDEAQDLNPAQMELIQRCLRPGGRVVAVGDRRQSIYGWRGADTEAIPKLIERLHARCLPLSITYRCPRRHVRLAQRIAPELQAAPHAPAGTISRINFDDLPARLRPGDLVLSRTNAPLFEHAFAMFAAGHRVCLRGVDLCAKLRWLAGSWVSEAHSMGDLRARLHDWHVEQLAALTRRGASDTRYAFQQDLADTLSVVFRHCRQLHEVLPQLSLLCHENRTAVNLATVHQAKGLEAERVFILRPDLMPMTVKQPWELQQERNIQYVALTRSRSALVFADDLMHYFRADAPPMWQGVPLQPLQ